MIRSSKTSNEMQLSADARSKSFVILTSAVSVLYDGAWNLTENLHKYHSFFLQKEFLKSLVWRYGSVLGKNSLLIHAACHE